MKFTHLEHTFCEARHPVLPERWQRDSADPLSCVRQYNGPASGLTYNTKCFNELCESLKSWFKHILLINTKGLGMAKL